jgi:predicted regulator of Ras-like GTPase activity (Roadblock/LC7/MglB family)
MPNDVRPGPQSDLDWLMADFIKRVPGTEGAVLASSDGMRKFSHGLSIDAADKLSAICTALCSLAGGVRDIKGPAHGRVRQVVIEHDNALLFVSMAGPGAVLGVLASESADVGAVGFEMGQLVKSVPEHLSTPPRMRPAPASAPVL